jgi:hypothetical protein
MCNGTQSCIKPKKKEGERSEAEEHESGNSSNVYIDF